MCLTILAGCSGANVTQITGSWAKPDVKDKVFNNILILGISENQSNRAIVEQYIADEMTEAGFKVTTAISAYTKSQLQAMKDDKEMSRTKLAEDGIDGILLITLLDIKEDTYYVPGTTSYYPMSTYPYYGGYYGYWGRTYTTVSSPGYYEESLKIFLESNIYDLATEELIYSAQSRTDDPSSVDSMAKRYAQVLVDDLVSKDILEPNSAG